MSFLLSALLADESSVTVHDDFESYASDSEVHNAWHTSSVTLQTADPVEGAQSITSTATQVYPTNSTYTSVDDEFWSIDVQFDDATADTVGILLHVQDESNGGTILDDCVRVRLDLQDDELDIQAYENGGYQTGASPATSEALTTGTRYRIGATVESGGNIVGEVHDVDANQQLVNHSVAYDPAWSSGIPGVYFQNSGLASVDYLRSDGG